MSIIHEALKKAGEPVTPEAIQKEPFRPELLKKRGRINWSPLFVVGILILVTAPILAPILNANKPDISSPTALAGSSMKAQFGVEEMPITPAMHVPQAARPALGTPKFLLTGLIYSQGGSYCLINGKVVKVGESVGGATLVNVTPNEAILEYQGEKIVLASEA